nr:putative ribonuclease H-like domain-containing protein [Tanacetum cinerariifolium]
MILESVKNGPLIWSTVEENGVTRTKKYVELSIAMKIQADCDMKATNIILQGLPADIYSLVNHHRVAKDLWEIVQLLMQGDDPIASLSKAMTFLTAVASSRFPSTNNQLRTSSNPRNQATIQDGRVTVQQVQRRQGQSYSSTGYKSNATSSEKNNAGGQVRVVKCYNCQDEGHMARQCTQPKRPRNATWYKDKAMLAEAQEAGQILDEEQLPFLADPGVPNGQVVQTIIPNAAFQTEDLDTYDSDCDGISNAKAVLMANIFHYGSDLISKVPHSETYLNDIENQSVHAMQDFKQSPVVDFSDNEIHSDSNIISYSQYLQETQLATVQDTTLQAQQDSLILFVIEQMSKQMINHVNNWEKANKEQNNESVTADLERYKERVKTFEQRLNINLSSREKMIDSQMDGMIKEKIALKEQVDSLEQNLSKQIKEKKCLLQTFTVFKSESKENEDKYMKNEIDLEKKLKELDNIIFKVGQSAQTVHMLTKPQVFYDNIHKLALGLWGYDDYQLGNVTISRVYYVEGLGHNLFSVSQFCDTDLEVAFWKNTCFIRNLDCVDLLSGSQDTSLYIISLDDMLKTSPICLLSKASKTKSWLWHRRLSHLNFGTLNNLAKDGLARGIPRLKFKKDHLCSACALGKSKKSSHQPKAEDTNQVKLYLLHMDLCGPMRVRILRSKVEAPDAIIKCIKNIQVRLNATVRNVRTDNGTEFVNQTFREFYENVDMSHQTSVARTPQQNGLVERRNRTLVEVARTMFIFSKALLFLWAEQSIQPATPKTVH